MSYIQVFNNPQFGDIRTSGTASDPMFCLADICKVLELQTGATKNRLDPKGVSLINTPTSSGEQQMVFVNEKNLYKVIMRSDKLQAEPFQDWVCGEVLPSIRKTGSYSVETLTRKQLAQMVIQAEEEKERLALENKEQQKQLEIQRPKVEHHEIFMNAEHGDKAVSVRKFIAQAGINGEKKFWHWMEYEVKGMIYRDSKGRPMPYAGKYRSIFAMPDTHNDKNDWSGTQLMITPIGKVELAKMYYRDHPENFYTNSSVITSNLFNNNKQS